VISSFYDVIVLGAELAPLTAGALLAKRGFRVLVIGQLDVPPTYTLGKYRLPRNASTLVSQTSPVFKRIVTELGMHQSVKRLLRTQTHGFQLVLPGHRVDLRPESAHTQAEIEREMPAIKRPIDELHRHIKITCEHIDQLLEREWSWPPRTFLARRAFAQASARLAYDRHGAGLNLLSEFPDQHPFRIAAQLPAIFDDGIDSDHIAPLRILRLYGNRLNATPIEPRELGELRTLLIERIRAHSGDVRLHERAGEITMRQGTVSGVRLFGTDDELGARFVVSGLNVHALLPLLPERGMLGAMFEEHGEPQARHVRFTVNMIIDRRGLPPGLGRDVFVLEEKSAARPHEHALYLHTDELDAERALISVQTMLSLRRIENDEEELGRVRAQTVRRLATLFPFLEQHAHAIDSPHDGLPPDVRAADIVASSEQLGRRGPATMTPVFAFPSVSTLGLCALPMQTPIKRLLLCNGQVAPGLGTEGELLTALGAARLITRSDRSKAWMRRRLWTKVES
jgi:hypothetical protein